MIVAVGRLIELVQCSSERRVKFCLIEDLGVQIFRDDTKGKQSRRCARSCEMAIGVYGLGRSMVIATCIV